MAISRRLLATTLVAVGLAGGSIAFWLAWRAPGPAPHGTERALCPLPAQDANHPHPGMVWVPGGRFEFGDAVYPEEQPIAPVAVAGFWMDRTEVTNDEFAAFVAATGHVTVAERPVDAAAHPELPPDLRKPGAVVFVSPIDADQARGLTDWWRYMPGANWRRPGGPATSIVGQGGYPVVAIAYGDALAYARWKGRALPSEAQWERAARAGLPRGAGEQEQPARANTWQGLFPVRNSADDGFVGLAPVGCYPANPFGLFDMIGNVWEITADEYADRHDLAPLSGGSARSGAVALSRRVIKGGSFLCAANYCKRYRAGARQPQEDDLAASHLGFRTVLNSAGP